MISKPIDVAIIGAGVSGLSARKVFYDRGLSTLTLEKARGSGGRMSTRRGDAWIADLGAQFTAASDTRWQAVLESLKPELIELKNFPNDRFSRFAHRQGMSALCRALRTSTDATEENIRYESKVTRLTPMFESNSWQIELENRATFMAHSVLLTAPVPQALELILKSGLKPAQEFIDQASRLQYSPCIAVVAELSEILPDQVPALWKNPTPSIAGIFDQKRKGLSTQKSVLVLHASASFSSELWDKENGFAMETILKELNAILNKHSIKTEILSSVLHRWRYCEPTQIHPEPFLALKWRDSNQRLPHLVLAGDAFGRSSVEGAFVSGASAAEFIANTGSANSKT